MRKNNDELERIIGGYEYKDAFFNMLLGFEGMVPGENLTRDSDSNGYHLPLDTNESCEKEITKHSVFRTLCPVFHKYGGPSDILAFDYDDAAEYVPEFGTIDVKEIANDFTRHKVHRNKLATILRASTEFVSDAAFNLEAYIVKRIGSAFAKTEDAGFLTGTGADEPVGILNDEAGAEIGTTVAALSYDSLADLFFSVDKDYRRNAVWLMNDNTALVLRKLKDEAGNPLWNQANDTIFGKPVYIDNDMPDADAGEKCIAFGDFSFYWIVKRSPVFIRTLRELFALDGKIGYLAYEFIDGKLIRRDAVKVLQIAEEE